MDAVVDMRDRLTAEERDLVERARLEPMGYESRLLKILDRLAPQPGKCASWHGSGGACSTCGVSAYLHPNAPTPASRGCSKFEAPGATGRGLGDAVWCGFCHLPFRDHPAGG